MFNWLLLMAWRDSRKNRGKLLLFVSSIVLGIAALVAIDSFSINLQQSINNEAKSLVGADLVVSTLQPLGDDNQKMLDSLGGEQARELNFGSMILFPGHEGTRFASIKAIKGNFPFYGKISCVPESASTSFRNGKRALVDKTLLLQFNMNIGDSIKVGEETFLIEGSVTSVPGQAGIASSVAPTVVLPLEYIENSDLVQKGSRVNRNFYFKFADNVNPELVIKPLESRLKAVKADYETVEKRKKSLGTAFSNLTDFLGLVGFIALLLGCIGVASAVHIYIKDKKKIVAVLRTLGASGRQSFMMYLIQICGMALIGSIVGAALGCAIQVALPIVLKDFLPVENITNDISWSAVVRGIVTGLLVSILFALLSLISIRNVSPLRVLRASFEENANRRDYLQWFVYVIIILFVGSFAFLQLKSVKGAIAFLAVIIFMMIALSAVAQGLMWLVRRFFPVRWSYVWRQGISNLYRPNNQTLILLTSIGLGTALVTTLFFTQDLLLRQVQLSGTDNQPNMILFDIQTPQKDSVANIVETSGMPVMQRVPIVTTRLESMDGVSVDVLKKDSTAGREEWALEREYRCTYRDTLIDTETISEGEFLNLDKPKDGKIYVSLADRPAKALKAKVGTKLTFNVQGVMMETEVSDIRQVNFNRIQTNFFVVFPKGILEKAPQFHVVVTRTKDAAQSASFQQKLVAAFSNISVVDLTQILKAVDTVLGKVSFVIRFMALFSILTGLIVLISSVALSKYQRVQESVLLRTIGASRRQILAINAIEYIMLGAMAVLTGIVFSFGGTWLLAKFVFNIPYVVSWLPSLYIFLGITILTLVIGLFNSREVLSKPPLEVLRNEA